MSLRNEHFHNLPPPRLSGTNTLKKQNLTSALRKSIAALLLVAACLFLACGCEPKTPPPAPKKLTIAVLTTMHPTLVKIAQARGFFREEGLDVTLQLHSSGKAALRSLIDGKADLATAADTPIMFALMQGAQLSLITTIETSTKNAAIIARRDRGIGCAADLKGRSSGPTATTSSIAT